MHRPCRRCAGDQPTYVHAKGVQETSPPMSMQKVKRVHTQGATNTHAMTKYETLRYNYMRDSMHPCQCKDKANYLPLQLLLIEYKKMM